MNLYLEILFKPLFNALIVIYNAVPGHDLGLTIIVITLVIRIILYPLNRRAIISQKAVQKIQPQIEELKEKYKDDREKLGTAMMELYKKEKVNPFASCLPVLIQIPILIALFQVFRSGLNGNSFNLLYHGVANPGHLQTLAFGFFDLAKRSIPLAVLAGLAQYWQTRMLMSRNDKKGSMQSAMNKQMLYLMPVMTIIFGLQLPGGLVLYWLVNTLLTIAQQYLTFKHHDTKLNPMS